MSDDLGDWAARAAAAQQAVNDLGAGPPQRLTPAQQSLLQEMQTPGSVLYGLLSWRSDSVMLARCRLIFMDLIALAAEETCAVDSDNPCGTCTPCRIHDLADRVQHVTRP